VGDGGEEAAQDVGRDLGRGAMVEPGEAGEVGAVGALGVGGAVGVAEVGEVVLDQGE